jgi:acetoacetyl-CoA synthetase
MAEPLWSPSPQAVESSQLTAFTRYAQQHTARTFDSYDALHAWSIEDPGKFWDLLWEFTHTKASRKGATPVENLEQFPGARWFPEARLNFAENLLQERSSKPAFISLLENGERHTVTYAELFSQTEAIATQLRALAIQPADRVAGWLPNIPETTVAMLATSSLGGVWSSCSPDFGAVGALDRFGQIEPRLLFACDGYYYAGKVIDIRDKVREVAAQVTSVEKIIWVPVLADSFPLRENETMWGDWLNRPARPLEFKQLPFDHPLYILYSSGTTGKPKCIVHGQGGTLLQHKKEHQLHLNIGPDDTLFFFTTCGWMMWNWLVSALATRCTIVLFDGSPFHPSPSTMFDICEQEQVTVFGISAKFLSGTQKAGVRPVASHQLNRMRMLISTGSPLTQEGFRYVYEDIKPDCHLVSMSGGTDLISCFMIGNPNLPVYEGELQSPGLGMAVEIWDDDGQPLSAGKGELVCSKAFPSSPVGFWNDPDDEKYKAAYFDRFPDIWVHGDYAEHTVHGGYIIHGRSDAVLNPGGVRIGTAEIYRQIEQFDEIVDAVCVGQDWQDDVRVVLFVVMREGLSLTDELIADIKLRIRKFASPRHTPAKVIPVADIPRTMSGKIAELAVRDVIHGRAVKNTSALANPEALEHFRNIEELTAS